MIKKCLDKNNITQYILFNCTPSLGLLDNWISVIYSLRKKLPNALFIFITPLSTIIDQIDLESNLIKISNDLFDNVLFKSKSGAWVLTSSFYSAKTINNKYNFAITNFLIRVFRKLNIYSLISIIDKIQNKLSNLLYKECIYNLNEFIGQELIILFDITEVKKTYNNELLHISKNDLKFSICHAVNINGMRSINNFKSLKEDIKNVVVYGFSEKERQYYKNEYLLDDNEIRIYGIPRHEKNWIKFLISNEKNKNVDFDNNYIFIISRPTGATLSPSEKIKSIVDINKIAKKYNLKIVIKRHPKELNDNLFEKVLGTRNYSKTWIYSNKHPFVLGSNCKFAVCFYSAVPADMIMVDTPTIERLDLTNVSQYNRKDSLIDDSGNPVTELRYFGLVLGSSNYEQLEKHAKDIIDNREDVIARLKCKYLEVFSYTNNINDIIVNEIYELFNKKGR